jgi:hypothetical protein
MVGCSSSSSGAASFGLVVAIAQLRHVHKSVTHNLHSFIQASVTPRMQLYAKVFLPWWGAAAQAAALLASALK